MLCNAFQNAYELIFDDKIQFNSKTYVSISSEHKLCKKVIRWLLVAGDAKTSKWIENLVSEDTKQILRKIGVQNANSFRSIIVSAQ